MRDTTNQHTIEHVFDTAPESMAAARPSGSRVSSANALDSSNPEGCKPTGDAPGENSPHRRGGRIMTLMEQPVIEREEQLAKIEQVIERKLRACPAGIKVIQLVRDVGAEVGCYEDEVFMALARLETRTNGDEIRALATPRS